MFRAGRLILQPQAKMETCLYSGIWGLWFGFMTKNSFSTFIYVHLPLYWDLGVWILEVKHPGVNPGCFIMHAYQNVSIRLRETCCTNETSERKVLMVSLGEEVEKGSKSSVQRKPDTHTPVGQEGNSLRIRQHGVEVWIRRGVPCNYPCMGNTGQWRHPTFTSFLSITYLDF